MKRKIDLNGRITIPAEIREELDLGIGDKLKIEVKDNKIILFKEK